MRQPSSPVTTRTSERLRDESAEDYRFLEDEHPELGEATSLVTDIAPSKWGSEVQVSCLHDPLGMRRPYRVLFQSCHRLDWSVHSPEYVRDMEADVVGFELRSKARDYALIVTDIFELAIWYGSYEVVKDW